MTKIKNIRYVGEVEQQCIMVNAKDHLYITRNNIVTNNTIVTGTLTELTFFYDAGKALALDTPIITPTGYTLMKDIQVGDLVMTPAGKPTRVRGVYPQGVTENYKITTADGREIIACGNHKWKASRAIPGSPQTLDWQILTTKELFESKRTWHLPLTEPVPFPEKSHIISPYLMGLWLGNGRVRSNSVIITSRIRDHEEYKEHILAQGIDKEYTLHWAGDTVQYIRLDKKRAPHLPDTYCQELLRLNLVDKQRNTMFIPNEYLYDSIENRIALLQGLLDSNGNVTSRGQILYITTSVKLRDTVQSLVHSLGGFASWRKTIPYKKHHCRGFVVQISFPSDAIIPFKLTRKRDKLIRCWKEKQHNHQCTLPIKRIVKAGTGETQCITVEDSEHLYLAGSYVPTHNSDDYIFKFFSKLRARIESRMKGNYFGRFILDSSPNTLESPIDDWVVHEAPKNPTNYIVSGSRWKWVPEDFPKESFDELGNVRPEKAFQVFIGGKGRPPAIIEPTTRSQYSPEDIIDVPDTFLIRGQFEENIYEALKDQAGIPAGSSDKIFYDHSKIEACFDPHLKNIYTHIVASAKDPPEHLIWNQIKDQFFIKYVNNYQFWYKPHVPRVFAVDQSISGDITSITIAHVERETRQYPNRPDPVVQTIYVVDLIIPITPKGGRVNLDAIRFLIEDLRDQGSMSLIHGSFDQFQSEATMQYLIRRGFDIERLSVDSEMDAYLNFISIIESGRLRSGRNLHLKNNLKSLQITRRKDADGKRTGSQKVDHSNGELVLEGNIVWEQSLIGIHAKDVSDTVCACCELLRKHDVIPYEEWKPDEIRELTRDDAKSQVEEFFKKHKWGIVST